MLHNFISIDDNTHTLSQSDYNHVCDHLTGLIEDIYTTGNLDDLKFHLEEILCVFGMHVPTRQPAIIKKPTLEQERTDRMLKAWVGYTRAYSEMMTK